MVFQAIKDILAEWWEVRQLMRREQTGVLEGINLTFGGAGNQVMTISGRNYATWIDSTKWPKLGSTVRFSVYIQDNGRGYNLVCADILGERDERPRDNLREDAGGVGH